MKKRLRKKLGLQNEQDRNKTIGKQFNRVSKMLDLERLETERPFIVDYPDIMKVDPNIIGIEHSTGYASLMALSAMTSMMSMPMIISPTLEDDTKETMRELGEKINKSCGIPKEFLPDWDELTK